MTLTVTALSQLREKAGTDLGTTGWLDITQDRVDTFADATGDHQWIHIDPERAARGPFGAPIAHGYLTLSLISLLFSDLLRRQGLGMSINYGLNRVRFPAPVPVGSRIRLTGRIAEVADVPGGLQLTYDFTVEVEGSPKPACVAQAIHRYHA